MKDTGLGYVIFFGILLAILAVLIKYWYVIVAVIGLVVIVAVISAVLDHNKMKNIVNAELLPGRIALYKEGYEQSGFSLGTSGHGRVYWRKKRRRVGAEVLFRVYYNNGNSEIMTVVEGTDKYNKLIVKSRQGLQDDNELESSVPCNNEKVSSIENHQKNKGIFWGVLMLSVLIVGIIMYLLGRAETVNRERGQEKEAAELQDVSEISDDDIEVPIVDLREDKVPIETDDEKEGSTDVVELEIGATSDNPIKVASEKLEEAIQDDIVEAKTSYQYKWLEVSGKVISVVNNEVRYYTSTYGGKTKKFTVGEHQYTIDGVTIKSGLIYWINNVGKRNGFEIAAEMDMSLCDVYYPQKSKISVVGYCRSISETDVVLTDGRYAPE